MIKISKDSRLKFVDGGSDKTCSEACELIVSATNASRSGGCSLFLAQLKTGLWKKDSMEKCNFQSITQNESYTLCYIIDVFSLYFK